MFMVMPNPFNDDDVITTVQTKSKKSKTIPTKNIITFAKKSSISACSIFTSLISMFFSIRNLITVLTSSDLISSEKPSISNFSSETILVLYYGKFSLIILKAALILSA